MEYNYFGVSSVSSSKGTIHIWKLDDVIQKEKKEKKLFPRINI